MGDALAMWRFYLGLYRGLGLPLVMSVLGAVVQPLLLLPIAPLIKWVFEQVLPAEDVPRLLASGAAILGLYALHALAAIGLRQLTLTVTKAAVERLRGTLVERLYAAPQAWYAAQSHGALHVVLVQDTERVDVFGSQLIARALPAALTAAALAVVLLALNWSLCLALALLAPLYFCTGRPLAQGVRRRVWAYQAALSEFGRAMLRLIALRDLTLMQGHEAADQTRRRAELRALRQANHAAAWWGTTYDQVQGVIVTAAGVVGLTLGGVAVIGGQLSVGGLLAFYVALALLAAALQTLGGTVPYLLAGQAALADLWAFWRTLPAPAPGGTRRLTVCGAVALEHVTFGYGATPVLRDVSLQLAPGEQAAVVGPNGAGKSTLAALLLGFYRPQAGRILVDGVPLDTLDLAAYRQQLGVVPQAPVLFAGTVRDNITYGSPAASEADVRRAAELTTAHAFIAALPDGYDTLLGEGGAGLSGGERQRIALARALVRAPRLLLLDEPTNHLDAATVRRLLANLAALPTPPTTLVISHDPTVVAALPRVYRLADGALHLLATRPLAALAP